MARIGVKASAKACAHMSAAHTGLRHSAETRERIGAANHRRRAALAHDGDAPEPADILDQDMSRGDLVYVLEHLSFRGRDRLATLKVDREARDFILDALRAATARQ
jgi:hypothetical protein